MSSAEVHTRIELLYRQSFGTLLNRLLQVLPGLELQEAEDVLQDAFSAALRHWEEQGIPQNPAGWVYMVSKNRAINWLKTRGRRVADLRDEELTAGGDDMQEGRLFDWTLGMLFACVHPDLAPKTQMIVTLKYVMNLKVEAIARAFAMTIDGVDKILVRGRHEIRSENIRLTVPEDVKQRLPVINKIIYLIFNEGYKASYGFELLREELCEEALLLCKELLDSRVGDHDSKALYALMLFNSARFKARFGPGGKLVDLENQDRRLWNRELIELGCYYLIESQTPEATSFQIEATIAWLHCLAPDFEHTNWQLVSELYAALLRINPNPFLELNRAVALFYAGFWREAIELAESLRRHPFFDQYYLLNVTLGKFYLREGNKKLAKEFFLKAVNQTHFELEREFIEGLIKKIDGYEIGT